MKNQPNVVEDPLLRQAVLDLFRASDAFRVAYQDFDRTAGRDRRALEALAFAEAHVDLARDKVARLQLDGP